jgi:hypothetical protein
MSYLRGPLTREQVADLTRQRPAATAEPPVATSTAEPVTPPTVAAPGESPLAPAPPPSVPVAYLDPAAAWAADLGARPGRRFEAAAVARVRLRYDETKADLVHDEEYEAVLHPLPVAADAAGLRPVDYDDRDLLPTAPEGAQYVLPAADLSAARWWSDLRRAVADELVRSRRLQVLTNPELRLWSRPGETQEAFAQRCRAAADAAADKATAELAGKAEAKVRALQGRLDTATSRAAAAESERNAQIGTDVASTVGSMLGGLLGGRRSRASVAAAARRAQSAQARVDSARGKAEDLATQLADVEADLAADVAALDEQWAAKAEAVEAVGVPLEKTDVSVVDLRLVWVPVG